MVADRTETNNLAAENPGQVTLLAVIGMLFPSSLVFGQGVFRHLKRQVRMSFPP